MKHSKEKEMIDRKKERKKNNDIIKLEIINEICITFGNTTFPRTILASRMNLHFSIECCGDRPSFYKFMKDIIREEQNTTAVKNQVLVGIQTQTKRKKYEKIDHRMRKCR